MKSKIPTLKTISTISLYNLTQDQNHLVILDSRKISQYISLFVRKSYSLRNETDPFLKELMQFIEILEKNAKVREEQELRVNKSKNKIKVKRRLVLIYDAKEDEKYGNEIISKLSLSQHFTNFYKFREIEEFSKNFGFLCLSCLLYTSPSPRD